MNTEELAMRIVDAIKNMIPYERGRTTPTIRVVKGILDRAVAEQESRIPPMYAKVD
jgi:hypothetical protein